MPSIFDEDHIRNEVILPLREFFYTLDQIAYLLDCPESKIINELGYFTGRSQGRQGTRLRITNIAAPESVPDWRVSELDFKVWMVAHGIQFTEPVPGRLLKRKNRARR
ncbi:hypothetical protein SEA_BENCZKOWSKI14_60 [Gordonia phage Benczkowski14]|uniref:Helix-turn-helix DNA binding protein n=5 Tax=Demosthenesvirus katyusha TaxID=1982108 RepID=A0A345MC98_9CAUD|nr:hypothetical protein BH765_gp59 [Gordonia phage Kvothe]YP_009603334.1 hypothetical protein FDH67_gp60 [Gordonia phage Katyusha]AMS03770.1 hypothetical protein SEA_BENCZKOWSKI14_60 [Gordonia phage Benczkowski14]AXH68119.1 helix-turn-helix DNA binding protein [Gordonia phage Teatealatte]QBP29617.1 helix-turn-helix DNA binding protein [Gordonia phage Tredge]UJD20696.1 helix-turn-helix DNA binding domain protein [Gordonia phage Niagara]AMS03453.1 hypothetical protein SEA_KATYUSHA_60 [Gordonia 